MRNDVETSHEANSHRLKHEQESNDNVIEFERDKRIRSRVTRKTDSQFSQKMHIKMNHRMNQLFHAE
jgi:hypothetical protein